MKEYITRCGVRTGQMGSWGGVGRRHTKKNCGHGGRSLED